MQHTPTIPLPEPTLVRPLEQAYWEQATEAQKTGIRVAMKTIPNIYCMERTLGFQEFRKKAENK
jgi:hypothetical protein